jgi:L-lactate permease
MNFKSWQTYAIVAAIIVVVFVIWFMRKNKPQNNAQQTTQQQNQNTSKPTSASTQTGWDVWNGTLQKSDNATKGNFMLATKERTIYLKTSRDFSQMVGKKVNVSYEGTWQNFVLGDVTLTEQE